MKRHAGGNYSGLDRRLEFSKHIRADESPFAAMSNADTGGTVFLGPDDWKIKGSYVLDRTVHLFGRGGEIVCEGLASNEAAIRIKADNVIIRGLNLTGTGIGYGILVEGNNVHVNECEFNNFSRGVYVLNSNYAQIDHNTFSNCVNYGIYIRAGYGCSAKDNVITNNPSGNGIYMTPTTSYSLVTGNVIPLGSITYTHTGQNNQPDNATKAGYTNVANSITVL